MVIVISAKGHASQEAAGNLHRRTSLAVRRASGFKEFELGSYSESCGMTSTQEGSRYVRSRWVVRANKRSSYQISYGPGNSKCQIRSPRKHVQHQKILDKDKIQKTPFAEHLTSYNRVCIRDFLLKQAYWYDKNKCPSGLRYYGDGGPKLTLRLGRPMMFKKISRNYPYAGTIKEIKNRQVSRGIQS